MSSELPSKTLVIVANNSLARFFGFLRADNRLEEFCTLKNADARRKEGELGTDSPGRTFDSVGGGRHRMEGTRLREQSSIRFAASVARTINALCADEKVYRLALVATPTFLGRLRPQLAEHTRTLLVAEIAKEMTAKSTDEILVTLAEKLLAPLFD